MGKMSTEPLENIEGLKDIITSWLRDPCFDLADYAQGHGFSKYHKELTVYELRQKIRWNYQHMERLIKHKDDFDPVGRAFELERTRKETSEYTDQIFELTGLNTMDYISE